MTPYHSKRVIFQPAAAQGIQRGLNELANAIRPTLGPLPRYVVIDQILSGKTPEVLDNGGLIARRLLQLPDRDADIGAMFLRQVLWRVYEDVGDGTATTAVLLQSIFNRGLRYLTAGGNATQLRRYLGEGLHLIQDCLAGMTVPVSGKEELAQVAESICYDPALAKMLGEVLDIIGEDGQLDIRSGRSREIEREYHEGMFWRSGIFSREMISDPSTLMVELQNPAILISDLKIQDPQALLPVLEAVLKSGQRSLVIIAQELSDRAISLMLSASRDKEKFHVIAVKVPGEGLQENQDALDDLSVLTGGRPLVQAAGDSLGGFQLEHLGRARRAWANQDYFGITAGQGDARLLRTHIQQLRGIARRSSDSLTRKRFQMRAGKLMGGSATLWVGANTITEIERRKELATRTADALRGAIRAGVIPGGGVAYLACRPLLKAKIDQAKDPDERIAYKILFHAMEAPIRTILENAGHDSSEVLAEVRLAGEGFGFDARQGKVVRTSEIGLWDSAAVARAAVSGAIASAALALSTEVLIHKKDPQYTPTP